MFTFSSLFTISCLFTFDKFSWVNLYLGTISCTFYLDKIVKLAVYLLSAIFVYFQLFILSQLIRSFMDEIYFEPKSVLVVHSLKGEQSFFFQINSKTLTLRKKILNFIFSTTFLLINYRGIKYSFKNHIEKNTSFFI